LTTPDVQLDRPLDRRNLIRGGAVLAGAAGATVIGAALSPTKAHAANGDLVSLGGDNAATMPTRVTIGAATGSPSPTLVLNNANGPSLALEALPQGTDISLGVGEIVNTVAGPHLGVDYGAGTVTTFLATGLDVTNAYPIQAERVLDTRSASSRANDVVYGSSGPRFDSLGRLAAGKFIDVAVANADELDLTGVFLNVTAFRPTGGGYVEVYTPGPRRALPSISFQRQITVTNSIFVAPSTSAPASAADTYYTVRVYTSRSTHLLIDMLGAVIGYSSAPATSTAAPDRRLQRQAKQRARLIKAIKNR
jgi:hypothetical protein